MPWTPGDAQRHNKAADTPAKRKRWAATATGVLAKTGDEGQAIRIANAAMRKRAQMRKGLGAKA